MLATKRRRAPGTTQTLAAIAIVATMASASRVARSQSPAPPAPAAPSPTAPREEHVTPPPAATPLQVAAPAAAPAGSGPPLDAPPGAAAVPLQATLPYVEGVDVPLGYEIKRRSAERLMLAGSATVTGAYFAALVAGVAAMATGVTDKSSWAPLFVPLGGPFVAAGTLRSHGAAAVGLSLLDGVAQMGGATLLIYGQLEEEKYPARKPVASVARPEVVVGPGSGRLTWRF